MKAAILEAFGSPLVIGTVLNPILGTGEVVVDVVAAGVLPYTNEVISNERRYMLELPIILGAGAVGRVRAIGPDATRLAVGDWVLCDPTVRSRDDATTPDITLQGLSARGAGGMQLQAYYHDGSYAQQMRLPTENAIALGDIDEPKAGRWCALQTLLVPYGGLLAANFQAGETLLVSGATGNFGSSCVAVALAIGAGCVVAPGRNEQVLNDLARRFGPRVQPVVLTGDEGEDRKRMVAAAAGQIDVVLDLLPPSAGVKPVRTAVMTVREYGRVVLMGGVGMLGGEDLALPYPWIMRNNITIRGQWMFPRHACASLISLVKSGLLTLEHFSVTEFDLDHANRCRRTRSRPPRTILSYRDKTLTESRQDPERMKTGVGFVEDHHGNTQSIGAFRTADIPANEERLLVTAHELLALLPFDELDLLVVDEMGKNLSGAGMDTNVTARAVDGRTQHFPRPVVRQLSYAI